VKKEEVRDPFSIRSDTIPGEDEKYFNPNNEIFVKSKWCYDTPGTISQDQILTLLTLEELTKMNSNQVIRPRTILVKPGSSYFLAGLARIDYLEGPHSIL
jgi:nitric oxide-associated protein 1